MNEQELKELVMKDEKVTKWIAGKALKKFLVVPNKLASIVV